MASAKACPGGEKEQAVTACRTAVREMLEEALFHAHCSTESLVMMIEEDKRSHAASRGGRLPPVLREAALALMSRVTPQTGASSECWFGALRIFDAMTDLEEVSAADSAEEHNTLSSRAFSVMARATATWSCCFKLTEVQQPISTIDLLVHEALRVMEAINQREGVQAESRQNAFAEMKEAVLAQERHLLCRGGLALVCPTDYSFLSVISKRFEIATHGSFGKRLEGANVWAQYTASLLAFRSPPSSEDNSHTRAAAVFALGLLITGIIPAGALAPANVPLSQWRGARLEPGTLPAGAFAPPGMPVADWESLRQPCGNAARHAVAPAALELAAELSSAGIRSAVQRVLDALPMI